MNKVAPGDRTGLWTAAAVLPVLSHAAALLMYVEPAAWLSVAASVRRGLAADALLHTALCVTIAAPVAGVAVVSRTDGHRPSNWRDTLSTLCIAVLIFSAMSALLTWGWMAGRPDAVSFIGRFHLTLMAVSLALAAWGALCGTWFREPLDAAGCSLITALLAGGGVLFGGAAIADLPGSVLTTLFNASPLIVLTTAAQIDIVRMDLLYQVSPLAHLQINYPVWYLAGIGYLTIALLCLLAVQRRFRTGSLASTT